jgi:hypothetical protein
MSSYYPDLLRKHYVSAWSSGYRDCRWSLGPAHELPEEFCVLEFCPRETGTMWTYATCCMSQADDEHGLEIHLFAPDQDDLHVELLTALAHYHRTGARVGLGDTVNFGRPWLPGSTCTHGLLSLPYLDGPTLEWLRFPNGKGVRFLWLVPITPEELEYKKKRGVDALEATFEKAELNYLDPRRPSVVQESEEARD